MDTVVACHVTFFNASQGTLCPGPPSKDGTGIDARFERAEIAEHPDEARVDLAKECLTSCRQQYLDIMEPTWRESYDAACAALAYRVRSELWPLYWCDAVFCGVWFNRTSNGVSQDPNVDLIINECQNVGQHLIYDPGPPPSNYTCPSFEPDHSSNPCTKVNLPLATVTVGTVTNHNIEATSGPMSSIWAEISQADASALSIRTTSSPFAPNAPSPSWSVTTNATSTTSLGESFTPATSATALPPSVNHPDDSRGAEISGGISDAAKISIAVSVSISGLAAVMLLLILCIRRRRRRRRASQPLEKNKEADGRDDGDSNHHSRDSPTPLLPRDGTRYRDHRDTVPPPRLSDRKLLSSFLKPLTRPGSPTLTPLTPNPLFPPSPLHAPPSKNLTSRNELSLKARNRKDGELSFMPGLAIISASDSEKHGRSSMDSYAASSTTARSSVRNDTVSNPVLANHLSVLGPTSPGRPQRPHETPLEIPGLIRPACFSNSSRNNSNTNLSTPPRPPPQRALPPPPVQPWTAGTRKSQTAVRAGKSSIQSPTRTPHQSAIGLALTTASPKEPPPMPAPSAAVVFPTAGRQTVDTTRLSPQRSQAASAPTSRRRSKVDVNEDDVSLADLTEEYAREIRDSWSSWFGSGVGTGGPGIGVPVLPRNTAASRRDSGHVPALLDERDLETLGGQY